MFNVMARWFYLIVTLLLVAIGLLLRFRHPEMTETELLLTFWWLWFSIGLFGLLGLRDMSRGN